MRRLKLVSSAPARTPVAVFGSPRKVLGAGRYESGAGCPQCGAHKWFVGRVTAECSACGEVLTI